jgi:hypothetical protein
LSPKFKVVKRIVRSNERPDDYYPCAATCVFLLTLPLYSTPEIMREKMKLAIKGPLNFMMVWQHKAAAKFKFDLILFM